MHVFPNPVILKIVLLDNYYYSPNINLCVCACVCVSTGVILMYKIEELFKTIVDFKQNGGPFW